MSDRPSTSHFDHMSSRELEGSGDRLQSREPCPLSPPGPPRFELPPPGHGGAQLAPTRLPPCPGCGLRHPRQSALASREHTPGPRRVVPGVPIHLQTVLSQAWCLLWDR